MKSSSLISALWAALFVVSQSAQAQQEVTISVTPVAGNISMLTGQGGNIGLFVGEDGTFLVDDQFAPLTEKILAAIKQAGGDAPRFVINTHFHGDHTGGNENLGKAGALLVSHDNVRARLAEPSVIAAFNMKSPAQPKAALPVLTFSRDMTFHINGETLHAIHLPQAHTDGDSFIHFQQANVIHAGDAFFNGMFPFIDVDHGGTLKGAIAGVERMLGLADEETRIIPGHGPLGDRTALMDYRDMLATAYQRLNALRNAGKSVEEAIAAKPLADLDTQWGKGIFTADKWIGVVYAGVY